MRGAGSTPAGEPGDAIDPSASVPTGSAARPASRRRARLYLTFGTLCLLTVLVGLLWIVVTGLMARQRLEHARADLAHLRTAALSGQDAEVSRLAGAVRAETADAHELVSGPAWWVGANLPFVGAPLASTRAVAGAVHVVGTRVVPAVAALTHQLPDLAGRGNATMNGNGLATLRREFDRAESAGRAAAQEARSASPSTWLPTVDRGRAQTVDALQQLAGQLTATRLAIDVAVPMLGADGPRNYFVAFENEAEMRGIGGFPGAYAILRIDNGQARFVRVGSDLDFAGIRADVDLGAEYRARYGSADPTGVIANSDISPNFPDAARIWAGMWRARTGQQVDGAIAVDPTALSYLLRVTGAAPLPRGAPVPAVTGANVVALTQSTEYQAFPDKLQRKKFVVQVARAIADRLTSSHPPPAQFVRTLARAGSEHRLLIWSAHPAEQRQLAGTSFAGVLDARGGAFTGFTVVNAAGSKLDYYLHRTMTYTRPSCGPTTTSTATLTLRNAAPRSGLPAYVVLRLDHPGPGVRAGDNLDIVTYYATPGSRPRAVTVDGKAVGAAVATEQGLTVVSLAVELPAGRTRTIRVTMAEPAVAATLRLLAQPGVHELVGRFDTPCKVIGRGGLSR